MSTIGTVSFAHQGSAASAIKLIDNNSWLKANNAIVEADPKGNLGISYISVYVISVVDFNKVREDLEQRVGVDPDKIVFKGLTPFADLWIRANTSGHKSVFTRRRDVHA